MLQVACLEKKIWSVKELETLRKGTGQGHHTIDHPEERGGERWSTQRFSLKQWKDKKGPYCLSDKHWKCFKGNVGETSERWGRVHDCGLFWAHRSAILNWTVSWLWLIYYERERERENDNFLSLLIY